MHSTELVAPEIQMNTGAKRKKMGDSRIIGARQALLRRSGAIGTLSALNLMINYFMITL